MSNDQPTSSYLRYLPAIFHQDPFVGHFLSAFEAILTGSAALGKPGLEAAIAGLDSYLDPQTAPEGFLPWLASWVALSLRADWDAETRRRFVEQIVPLYRLRGTPTGLRTLLELYTREKVAIYDDFNDPAHFFQVQITLSDANPERLREKQQIARAIIDQEKPAHTFYALKVSVPTMRIVSLKLQEDEGGKPALLIMGQNTILGS